MEIDRVKFPYNCYQVGQIAQIDVNDFGPFQKNRLPNGQTEFAFPSKEARNAFAVKFADNTTVEDNEG